MNKRKTRSVFEQLKAGLEDSIAHARGELTLNTIRVPAPPPEVSPQSIVRLRKSLRMSQSVFAATLNVSVKTVQSWEQGLRAPSRASLRLVQVLREEPQIVRRIAG